MVRTAPSTSPSPDEALQEIDDLLEEMTRLTRTSATPRDFHAEMLDRAVRALAAVGGAFWVPDAGQHWQIDARADSTAPPVVERLNACEGHRELLSSVLRGGEPRLVLPGAAGSSAADVVNPTEFLLLLCPVQVESDQTPIGVLEVVQRPGASPAAQQGYLRLLAALCDLAVDFHEQRRMRLWQDRAARTAVLEQFAERAHASLDLAATAAAIANEGRRVTQCDRLSVAQLRRRSCRVLAISGQEQVDRRANVVRRLEALTRAVALAGEPLWHGEQPPPLPPQIAVPLQSYIDDAHPKLLAIVPVRPRGADGDRNGAPAVPIGALIIERFSGTTDDEAFRERVAWVSRQGGLALSNAIEHRSLPLFLLLRACRRAFRWTRADQIPRALVVVVAAVAAVLSLIYVPADFEVSGRGALQPELRREVFARADGIVSEVRVDHGQACRKDETLAVLTRSQLDLELARVLGELNTATTRLAGVRASRLNSSPQSPSEQEKHNQLAAEEEELKELLKSLERQRDVLRVQQEELLVKSPIDGQVITWNVRESLEARPVQRGQALLTVADLDGPWVLEVDVPDDKIGHVLAARKQIRADLDVSFMLATAPGATYHGTVEKVALATKPETDEVAHVLVTVRFDRDQIPRLRPGATVVPRIDCGKRPLGYVWFHSVWEAIQKYVLF